MFQYFGIFRNLGLCGTVKCAVTNYHTCEAVSVGKACFARVYSHFNFNVQHLSDDCFHIKNYLQDVLSSVCGSFYKRTLFSRCQLHQTFSTGIFTSIKKVHDSLRAGNRSTSHKVAFIISGGCLSVKKRKKLKKNKSEVLLNTQLPENDGACSSSIETNSAVSPNLSVNHEASETNVNCHATEVNKINSKMKEDIHPSDESVSSAYEALKEMEYAQESTRCENVHEIKDANEDIQNYACVVDNKEPLISERLEESDFREAQVKDKSEKEVYNVLIKSPLSSFSEEEGSISCKSNLQPNTKERKRKRKIDEQKDNKKRMENPNHFIGIQFSDSMIQDNLKTVQNYVIAQDKRLKPALVPIATLHLTLIVFRTENDDDLTRATEALETCYEKVKDDFTKDPLLLEVHGLGDFKKQVVFAKLKPGRSVEKITELSNMLATSFDEASVSLAGNKEFKPHLTIMKMSKARKLLRKGIKFVKTDLYEDFTDDYFGSQYVKSLQLLSMIKPKTKDGYYYCEKEFHFSSENDTDVASSTCSKMAKESFLEEQTRAVKEVKNKFSSLTKSQLEAIRDKKK